MTWYQMFDASTPPSPDQVKLFDVAAGYIGGATPHVWTQAEWDSMPNKFRLPIYVPTWFRTGVWNISADLVEAHNALAGKLFVPEGCTVALDMETEVNADYVSQFDDAMKSFGYPVLTYGSTSTLFNNPLTSAGWWVANPTDVQHMYDHANTMATQYGEVSGGAWDLNVIDTAVVLWDPTAPIIEEGDEMPILVYVTIEGQENPGIWCLAGGRYFHVTDPTQVTQWESLGAKSVHVSYDQHIAIVEGR